MAKVLEFQLQHHSYELNQPQTEGPQRPFMLLSFLLFLLYFIFKLLFSSFDYLLLSLDTYSLFLGPYSNLLVMN